MQLGTCTTPGATSTLSRDDPYLAKRAVGTAHLAKYLEAPAQQARVVLQRRSRHSGRVRGAQEALVIRRGARGAQMASAALRKRSRRARGAQEALAVRRRSSGGADDARGVPPAPRPAPRASQSDAEPVAEGDGRGVEL